MELTAHYSSLDLKNKYPAAEQVMICSRGQVLILKEKLEQSITFSFRASSCKFHRLGSLKLIRGFFFGSETNNKTPNATTQKACGALVERYA